MNKEEMLSMFADLSDSAREMCVRNASAELTKAITQINADITTRGLNANQLVPTPENVFRAFVVTPPEQVRVVLVGQDPYPAPGEACGLAFSSNGKKIPHSLRAIYKCLIQNKLMVDMPRNGDVSHWAKQGVLLLNTALTTIVGTSGAHVSIWKPYIDNIVNQLDKPGIHWMLFGADAQRLPIKNGIVHKWGHPSPLNRANAKDSPTRFELCPAFSDVAAAVGIIWDPLAWGEPAVAANRGNPPTYKVDELTYWLFTDGGAKDNGKVGCKASFAWTAVYNSGGELKTHSDSGAVPPVLIPGKRYSASNQRGELMAVLEGMKYINGLSPEGQIQVIIVTDSDYSLNCITKWYPGWVANDAKDKMNIDLIAPAYKVYTELCEDYTVLFQHVRSHTPPPAGIKEYFIWYYNDQVDKLCSKILA